MSKENIVNIILEVIRKNVGVDNVDINENLFSDKYKILPLDMIYIIDDLEKSINKNITSIFENCNESIMTVNNLGQAIANLSESRV